MGKKKSQADWLAEKIGFLCKSGDSFVDSLVTLEYGPHTLLKLICIFYYAEMFAPIAKGQSARQRNYDGALYVDLFAGPGIVTIRGTGDRIAGSPVAVTLAAMKKQAPFDHSIFVESNAERCHALEKRLSKFLPTGAFTVLHGDCNREIHRVMRFIHKEWNKPILLTFVDPEGMEARWKTMELLSRGFLNVDFVVNLTSGVSRVAGKLAAGMEGYKPIFEDFFGENAETILVKASQGQPISQQYESSIKSVLGRPMGATIPIKDETGHIVYQILGYTRLSLTGSPWTIGLETLRTRLEGVDGSLALSLLNVLKGRQKTLSQ